MSRHQRPVPGWALPAAIPASWIYGLASRARHAAWSAGVGVHSIDAPVVSVGNLVAGGTGKSPMSRQVCSWLLASGVRPLLATRGYGAVGGLSDEVEEFRSLVPDAAVAVGANRRQAIARARAAGESFGAVVLDDGFQHRSIARDLDIVLIDGQRPCLRDHLLPAGWLREPASALRRAQAIVVTQADDVDDALGSEIECRSGCRPIAWCKMQPSHLDVHRGHAMQEQPLSWLEGKPVVVWAALARPERVVSAVRLLGASVRSAPPLRDHHPFDQTTLKALLDQARGAAAIVVTGKDWPKLVGRVPAFAPPIAVVRASWRFAHGEAALHSTVLGVVKPNPERS